MAGSDTSSSPTDSTVSVEFVLDESVQLGFGEAAKFSSHAERHITSPSIIMSGDLSRSPGPSWEVNQEYHMSLFSDDSSARNEAHVEEIKTTPLFSAEVLAEVNGANSTPNNIFREYGLLAKRLSTYNASEPVVNNESRNPTKQASDSASDRLFLNINAPWSAFICGSQGSGKSHTLSCMLEMALLPSKLGELPKPLAGIVFHYDKFTGYSSSQICEAAYLCSLGIPVRVLVSKSSCDRMKGFYSNLPGLTGNRKKPKVIPLLLNETQLTSERVTTLMAVNGKEKSIPLYMEAVRKIMREIGEKTQEKSGFDYTDFQKRLDKVHFTPQQRGPLNIRLDILNSFLDISDAVLSDEEKKIMWKFEPGSLTIIDLSCQYVNEADACALFNICLSIFLENREGPGRIVALDEAHKFMGQTDAASSFTESLLSVIRQQRHLATRVIIATQEPTISPQLIDLSSMTIVHRFTSPNWFQTLKGHLAGLATMEDSSNEALMRIFKIIVNLRAGQALLFSPSAMLGLEEEGNNGSVKPKPRKLGERFVKMGVRKSLASDGGRSILAA